MKDFFEASKNGDTNKLKEYIKQNIEINKFDDEGFSALMLACIFNKYDSADILIKNNAYINLKTSENWTALMFASFYGNYEIAELLLKNNAVLNIKNKQGFDALLISLFYKRDDITKLLINYGANVNTKNNEESYPETFREQIRPYTFHLFLCRLPHLGKYNPRHTCLSTKRCGHDRNWHPLQRPYGRRHCHPRGSHPSAAQRHDTPPAVRTAERHPAGCTYSAYPDGLS